MRLKSLRINSIATVLFCALVFGCSSKTGNEVAVQAQIANSTNYEVSEDKSSLAEYYKLDHIKEWYPERILPPVFDYDVVLSNKSIVELSLLRNEIFARNGYLFEDAVLRGYFNQFKWYQPIFDVPEFKVQLNKQEQIFVDKILAKENELLKDRYIKQGKYTMINLSHVYNEMQFKTVPDDLKKLLAEKNFAIVPAKHEQFFHVYDNNHYTYIPNFITTDIYLQVLHKHFSSILQKIEEDKFIPLLTDLLENVYQQSLEFNRAVSDEKFKKAAQWSSAYLAIACHLITGRGQFTPNMDEAFKVETEKILTAQGAGSEFLKTEFIQYSQFKPRGNYTKTEELKKYFRCVKWLNTAPIFTESDERFLSAILIASSIKRSPEQLQAFQRFNEAIKFIVGEEDNLSISNLISVITDEQAKDPSIFNDEEELRLLREKLEKINVDKIRPKGGDDATAKKLSKEAILFTAGRYTFDAEVLSRLIHVLRPESKRPFPKGLDVFASLGNQEAANILLTEYNEQKQ